VVSFLHVSLPKPVSISRLSHTCYKPHLVTMHVKKFGQGKTIDRKFYEASTSGDDNCEEISESIAKPGPSHGPNKHELTRSDKRGDTIV
jgi:hypothetical protein